MEKIFYQHEHKEVSLVDIAVITCRRWKIALAVFLVIFGAVVALVMSGEKKYTYNSVYKVAEQRPTQNNELGSLEPPSAVAAKIRTLYANNASAALMKMLKTERLDFDVTVTNPNETLLLVIESEAAESNAQHVTSLHEQILQRAQENQQISLQRRKETLEKRRDNTLERAQNILESSDSGELAATYADQVAEIEAHLAELVPGEIVQLAERSTRPVGLGRLWKLVLGGMVAVILALGSAWLWHFAALVVKKMKSNHRAS
ncbi:hypothetical protein LG290_12060 [Halomonas sediminis]